MSSISFFCAVCGEALRAAPSYGGSWIECDRCERSVPVPGFPPRAGASGCSPVYSPEILSMDVHFLCRGCETKLVVDARWEGHQLDCPRCQAPVTVPWWSGSATVVSGRECRTPAEGTPTLTPEEIGFLSGEPIPMRA